MEEDKKPQPRKRKKHKKYRSKMVIIMLALWVVVITGTFAVVVNRSGVYNELSAELARLNAEIAAAQAINSDLQFQIEFFDSDVYVERTARERLGMVRQNEIVFRNTAIAE